MRIPIPGLILCLSALVPAAPLEAAETAPATQGTVSRQPRWTKPQLREGWRFKVSRSLVRSGVEQRGGRTTTLAAGVESEWIERVVEIDAGKVKMAVRKVLRAE